MGLLSWLFGSKESKNKQNRENTERVRQQEREKNLRAIGRNPDGSMISDKKEKESEPRNVQNTNTVSASSGIQSQMKSLVTKCLQLETKGNVSELQNCLFQLYSMLNKPGTGKYIVLYAEKDNLALCFAFMLQYDWVNDSDIREVWAEDGLYCIIEHLDHQPHGRQGQAEAMIILLKFPTFWNSLYLLGFQKGVFSESPYPWAFNTCLTDVKQLLLFVRL